MKMHVRYAQNGKEAVEFLQKHHEVDIVLMDIMMPEMDGYEAMRQIRRTEGLETLPMIALTAKAMKGDRERCIEAGASDYIPKPVDSERLLSVIRVWLYR
jgi:CheY-like chemotaxis protein